MIDNICIIPLFNYFHVSSVNNYHNINFEMRYNLIIQSTLYISDPLYLRNPTDLVLYLCKKYNNNLISQKCLRSVNCDLSRVRLYCLNT